MKDEPEVAFDVRQAYVGVEQNFTRRQKFHKTPNRPPASFIDPLREAVALAEMRGFENGLFAGDGGGIGGQGKKLRARDIAGTLVALDDDGRRVAL